MIVMRGVRFTPESCRSGCRRPSHPLEETCHLRCDFAEIPVASRLSQLQEPAGILIIDFVLVFRRQAHLIDQLHAFLFEHEQRR